MILLYLSLTYVLRYVGLIVINKFFLTKALPKRLISVFEVVYEADSSPSLKLGPRWKEVILDPNLTNLYFDVSTTK